MTIKFVLTVATFSRASENAVERAAEIAARHCALLYVVQRPGGDTSPLADFDDRLAQRSAQLERRHGIEVRNPVLSERQLLQMLERTAQDIVVVVDRATACRLTAGQGWLSNLASGLLCGSSLLDVRACPILVVNRPGGEPCKAALLPYETAQDAERAVALARQMSADTGREMFFVGPQRAPWPAGASRSEPLHRSEWPPPGAGAWASERVVHSNYMSTRQNRAIVAFDTASTARRIRNQASFSGAGLVIVPYIGTTFMERALRRSLRERLTRELACDLAFLPDPGCQRTAPMARERLARQGRVVLRPLATSQESRHG
ncbi:hypothetical protein [Roseateles sp.]|uniref:hypothetical protein n=1 Tax=Roseateles sp. TaxID=1971397 RepID=UPI0025FE372F|nr:hypothetical protein [Roseateles sp.]MBV8037205.1 hypothetical protein [Roseateles sp.]